MTEAPTRLRLPNRRLVVTEAVLFRDHEFLLSLGFDPGGQVREVWIKGNKTGSDYETLMDDACVLVSLALQLGQSAEDVAGRLGRAGVPDGPASGTPSSPIGLVVERAVALETVAGDGIRAAYAAYAARRREHAAATP